MMVMLSLSPWFFFYFLSLVGCEDKFCVLFRFLIPSFFFSPYLCFYYSIFTHDTHPPTSGVFYQAYRNIAFLLHHLLTLTLSSVS